MLVFPTLPLCLVLVFPAYRFGVFSIAALVDAGILFLSFCVPCCSQEVIVVATPAAEEIVVATPAAWTAWSAEDALDDVHDERRG